MLFGKMFLFDSSVSGTGTLPDHMASGEERFLVEMDETGNVGTTCCRFLAHGKLPRKSLSRYFAAHNGNSPNIQHARCAS
jgi:hypothetical protein